MREGAVCKGPQHGVSTAGENAVGFCIAHQPAAQILWYTSDQHKASERLNGSIIPMLQQSGLMDRIKSSDEDNGRKTGKTARKLEWIGGGSLKPLGAQNSANFREHSAQIVIRDEIDAWPIVVAREGDPLDGSFARTKGFEDIRKVLDLSTPTITGLSKIWERYLRGDQRKYHVKCLECRTPQVLRWTHINKETGEVTGITWDLDPKTKTLIADSVRYRCIQCGHPHREEDKLTLFGLDNAEWIPTATPVAPYVWSWHLPSLISIMESWASCVLQWLEAWDVEAAKPRDMAKLQAFYNNVLAEPFELTGDRLKFEDVSRHRNEAYRLGQIPNLYATKFAGSPIQVLTCTVDVQKAFLSVAVWGWTKGRRGFLIDYFTFEGPTEYVDEPSTWGALEALIRDKIYTADDGKQYPIELTLVDSGYIPSTVHEFVGSITDLQIVAIRGEANPKKSEKNQNFSRIHTPHGDRAFEISVNGFKERLHHALHRAWTPALGEMPEGHIVFPSGLSDDAIKELTIERRIADKDPRTGQRKGWKWHRPNGSRNELWDLLVYGAASLEMLCWNHCHYTLGLDATLWGEFWAFTERGAYFISEPK